MPFELSKAFFSVLSGCFYREKPHRAKNESGMNHFLRHHQNASCKKRYKEIGMVLWYTVSIKTAAATNCADRFNVKKPQ